MNDLIVFPLPTLRHLVSEAVALGGGDLCRAGHRWEVFGGRYCEACDGSKPVFECTRCGECDYGDRVPCGSECDMARQRLADEIAAIPAVEAMEAAESVDPWISVEVPASGPQDSEGSTGSETG